MPNVTYSPKFSKRESECIINWIFDARLRRFSARESLAYVNEKMQYEFKRKISEATYQKYVTRINKEQKIKIRYMKPVDPDYLKELAYEKIKIYQSVQQEAWAIFRKNKDNPHVQLRALDRVNNACALQANVEMALPIIDDYPMILKRPIKELDKNLHRANENEKKKQSETETGDIKNRYGSPNNLSNLYEGTTQTLPTITEGAGETATTTDRIPDTVF